jgi:hypothetical protein
VSLRAGTTGSGPVFEGTMAESIARGLDAEIFRLTQKKPPPFAQDERRALFAAIAQGVIDYLRQNQDTITITIANDGGLLNGVDFKIEIEAPTITATLGGTPRRASVGGVYFTPYSQVSLRWLDEPAPTASTGTDDEGAFTNAGLGVGSLTGRKTIVASDPQGRVAFTGVQL